MKRWQIWPWHMKKKSIDYERMVLIMTKNKSITREFVQNDNNNAICYYRYSPNDERGISIEQQKELAHSYAEGNGLQIIKEYEDRITPGTTDDRDGVQDMLYEVKCLKPAYLILYTPDRLSRDRYESVLSRRMIMDAGCKIVYTDMVTAELEANKQLVEVICNAYAEYLLTVM